MNAEGTYHAATPAERRRIRVEVVAKYRPLAERIARELTARWPDHQEAAEQVAIIGLLVGLDLYRPSPSDAADGFVFVAARYVREQLRRWLDAGTVWRPVARLAAP